MRHRITGQPPDFGTFSEVESRDDDRSDDNSDDDDTKCQLAAFTRTPAVYYPEGVQKRLGQTSVRALTQHPKSLVYKTLTHLASPNLPPIFIELVAKLDQSILPFRRACNGLSVSNLMRCDRIMSTAIASTEHENQLAEEQQLFSSSQLLPSQSIHLMQIFFARLESAPFVASASLCEMVRDGALFLGARLNYSSSHSQNAPSVGIMRALRDSWKLQTTSIEQRAMHCYFLQRCQRWCQSEVTYRLEPNTTANLCFMEAVGLLADLFADVFIDIDAEYKSHKIQQVGYANYLTIENDLKFGIFITLLGGIGSNVWHAQSVTSMQIRCRSGDEKCAGGAQDTTSTITTKISSTYRLDDQTLDEWLEKQTTTQSSSIRSEVNQLKNYKVRSFNWL